MSKSKQWVIFIVCALAVFMVDIDFTAVNLVLSNIASALGEPLSTMQWVITGYMIAAGALMAFGGRLADIVGYRRVFLVGLVVFGLSSAGVGFSHSATEMICFRLIQGAAIAFTFPISIVVLRFVFPKTQLGFVTGLMVTIAGFSQAIGPSFGAYFLVHFGWRSIFLLNVPLTALTLIAAYCLIPKPELPEKRAALHGLPISLFVGALFVLMYGLSSVSHWGVLSLKFLSCCVLSLLALAWVVRIENRSEEPILNFRLFRIADMRYIYIVRFLLVFVYYTLLFVLGLLLQNVLHYSIEKSGSMMLLMTLVIGVLSIPSGKLVDKVGAKCLLIWGVIFLLVGLILLGVFSITLQEMYLMTALCVLGVSFAMTIPASASVIMLSAKPQEAGSAMGLFFTVSFIGDAVGIAVSAGLLYHYSAEKLMVLLRKTHHVLNAKQLHHVLAISHGAYSSGHKQALFSGLNVRVFDLIARHAFLYGFLVLLSVAAVFGLVSLAGVLRLRSSA